MKKSLFILVWVVIVINIGSLALADDIVKIGIFEPITGVMSLGGALCMKGYEIAQEQKPTVLGKKVELILIDNKSDKAESASAVSRLIEKEGVIAVLGSYGSSCSIPGSEVAEKAGIPMLSASTMNPLVTEGKEYIFRCCFIDSLQGEIMARYTYENLGIKKSALLIDIFWGYLVSLAESYKDIFTKLGGEVVADLKYNNGDQNFSAQLNQIINSGAEALFFPGYFADVALIAIQGRELGYTGKYLGGDTLHNPVLVELAGEAVEGLIVSTFFAEDVPVIPELKKFITLFKEKYNETPNVTSILAYDAYNLILDAIERAGSFNPVAIKDALAQTKEFLGASGDITINGNGDAIKPVIVVKVVNGDFVYETTVHP